MNVSFSQELEVDFSSAAVNFHATADGRRVRCRISGEALCDHSRAKSDGTISAFLKNYNEIEARARKLIEQQRFETDGSISIRTADIGER